MSGTQLNATTTVPGSWAYSPAAGTVLAAGAGQPLSVTFTPTDTATYNSANATVAITVLKATPLITWANPADITSGTPLSATQLNATANVAGTFAYSPPSGTVLGVGAGQQLSTTFTPTSTANYNTASKTVLITVNGTPTTRTTRRAPIPTTTPGRAARPAGWPTRKPFWPEAPGRPGLVLWIGDSLTRDPALGAWAQSGAGKTARDQAITNWMHAGAVAAEHRQHRRVRAGDAVFLFGAKLHGRRRSGRLGLHGRQHAGGHQPGHREAEAAQTARRIPTRST